MALLLRHLLSAAILPGSALILVPYLLSRRADVALAPGGPAALVLLLAGLVLLAAGGWLFTWSLRQFWAFGRGTLAPWDPPRAFVASGPYRIVRNPMITGVFVLLLAEACLLRSPAIGLWAAAFIAINAVYIPLSEEPALCRRFGAPYVHYLRSVPRFLPRRRRKPDGRAGRR